MNEMEERVARALMEVTARPPAADALGLLPEIPVLASDPDFDDLPRDHTEGTQDDDITQEAVLRLARAAIMAMREPTKEMLSAGKGCDFGPPYNERADCMVHWHAMIDAALNPDVADQALRG